MHTNVRTIRFLFVALLGLAVLAAGLWATRPTVAGSTAQGDSGTAIPYQGRLTGDDGQPVADAAYDFTFEIYETQGDSAPLWTETQTGVAVRDGYFSVLLGSLTPLGAEVVQREYYLAVSVRGPGDDGLTALEPRQQLDSFMLRPQQGECIVGTAEHDHWGETWTGSGFGFDLPWTGLFLDGPSIDARLVYHYEDMATSWDSGLYGESTGSRGTGVRGVGSSYGVHGKGIYGVYGTSDDTAGRGVFGYASASSGTTYGVYGISDSPDGQGVFGDNNVSSGVTYGVRGESSSPTGRGVFGGVYGNSTTDTNYGVRGYSTSNSGRGVYGYANATSGSRFGVGGGVNGTGYGLYAYGNLYVQGSCVGCTMVFIARNAGLETLRVGDVVAASGVGATLQGHTTPILEARQATASDASVLGVVYSRGEFYAASGDDPEDFGDSVQPVEGDVAPDDYMLVVTSGLAQVRVASASALKPGQSLTVGVTTGRATLASADAEPGLVFARAMEVQPDENGLLWAMVDTR